MQVLEGEDDLGHVEAGGVLQEDALPFQVHEELSAAEVLEDQVELSRRLGDISIDILDIERFYKRSFGPILQSC